MEKNNCKDPLKQTFIKSGLKYLLNYWSVAMIFTAAACNNKNQEKIDSFSDLTEVAQYDTLLVDNDLKLGQVEEMIIHDSLLIIKSYKSDYNFAIVNINDGSLLKQWGRVGRGPDEFLMPSSCFMVNEQSELVFSDIAKKELMIQYRLQT